MKENEINDKRFEERNFQHREDRKKMNVTSEKKYKQLERLKKWLGLISWIFLGTTVAIVGLIFLGRDECSFFFNVLVGVDFFEFLFFVYLLIKYFSNR